nr:hypothetical protein [Chloroflexota bacterium]
LATTGNFFGVGAYLFVDRGHLTAEPQTGQVRWWPNDGLPDPLPASVPTPPAIPINAVTPRLLDFTYDDPETTDVAEHRPQADRLADVSLQNVCYDVNFDVSFPWKINGQAAASHDDRIKRGLSTPFPVTFRFAGPGPDPTPPANTGTVELRLKPYGNLGTGSQVEWIKEETGISANYDAARSVDFIYDFSKTPGTQDGPPSEWADYGEFSFICATMKLKDFPLDDDKSYNSNVENVNWNYFETSEYKQTFYITADGIPGLNPGESTTILLHAEMNNEGQNIGLMLASVLSPVATPIGVLVLSAAVLTTLLLVRLKRTGTTSYKYALLLVVLLVLGVTASCAIICKTCAIICKEKQPTSRWEFGNARELGITPMEGEPGWYEVPIRFGEIKGVELEVNGMPLPYRTQQIQLLPTASDNRPNMLPLQVKPQQVVTIVALGNIDLDGPGGPLEPTSAHGFIRRDTTGQQRYLLRDGYYTPSEYAGALIGSFDGFRKTSFVVGRTASIMVPEGANTLTLAVNAIRGTYELVSGSFELSIIRTPPPQVPTFDDMQGDGTYEVPHTFSLWDTLTSLSVYTYYETVQLNETDMAVSRTRHPLAFSHYAVYDSHNQRVRQPGLVRMRQ